MFKHGNSRQSYWTYLFLHKRSTSVNEHPKKTTYHFFRQCLLRIIFPLALGTTPQRTLAVILNPHEILWLDWSEIELKQKWLVSKPFSCTIHVLGPYTIYMDKKDVETYSWYYLKTKKKKKFPWLKILWQLWTSNNAIF